MAMTKKDFVVLADALIPWKHNQPLLNAVADACAKCGERFNRNMFLDYIKYHYPYDQDQDQNTVAINTTNTTNNTLNNKGTKGE